MRKDIGTQVVWCLILGLVWAGPAWAAENRDPRGLRDPAARKQWVQKLNKANREAKAAAQRTAKRHRWAVDGYHRGARFELQAIRRGRPYVYTTHNVNAAISSAADLVRNVSPYSVDGSGYAIGIWDGGAVRPTHQEFNSRVTVKDGAFAIDHATHVGGTIAAAGVDPLALGMAPGLLIDSYDWDVDTVEMAARGMATAGQAGTLQVSSHSYGYITGWYGYDWYGVYPAREDEGFGLYDASAAEWDEVCYNSPYFLPFKSAGNDRNDTAPSAGVTFRYLSGGDWISKVYDPSVDPYSDSWDNGGYDTVSYNGTAKNIMTVGAVNDAVSGGSRSLANATIASFSCWGPCDDGRIKPDIVGNGVNLYSTIASSDAAYAVYSGTSMSTPNVSGSAMLIIDYYGDKFPAEYMLASTLKGLIIHTADDLDEVGPDYRNGWGLMNVQAAVEHIADHAASPSANRMVEAQLAAADTMHTYSVSWDGVHPLKATICWTDPPATSLSGLDNPSIRLVNDLDLRIVGPDGVTVYEPFVLDPANPATAAVTGDNIRDNVEQVLIAAPTSGDYSVRVTYKGTLTNGAQTYSLLISGATFGPAGVVSFSQLHYACSATAGLEVTDGNLAGAGTTSVYLMTDNNDSETVTLNEQPGEPGVFTGSISFSGGSVTIGNGTLEVVHGTTITALYLDNDAGGGQGDSSYALADLDCLPPVISNVLISNVTQNNATVSFTTDETAQGQVNLGLSCGALTSQMIGSPGRTSHSIVLGGLTSETSYHLTVQATDLAGNTALDDSGGACYSFTTPSQIDYFTQLFGNQDNDMDYLSITYYPDNSSHGYHACTKPVSGFFVDPAGATPMVMADDGSELIFVPNGNQVRLYDQSYGSFYVASNGFITFLSADTEWQESLSRHFNMPRISALFDDLDPTAGGSISYMHLADRSVVTWNGVPEYNDTQTNSLQVEMFYDGRIRCTYLGIDAADGLVGLSKGLGVPTNYLASDMSNYAQCPHRADFDGDGDVDADDMNHMVSCASGAAIVQTNLDCADTQLDEDEDSDLDDFGLFQRCFSGVDIAPDPLCLP